MVISLSFTEHMVNDDEKISKTSNEHVAKYTKVSRNRVECSGVTWEYIEKIGMCYEKKKK